jgi:hypothetical protein
MSCFNQINRQFSKQELQIASNHMKKWPTSLAIKELQIKTTLIHSFQSAWLSIISNKQQKMLANVPGKKES